MADVAWLMPLQAATDRSVTRLEETPMSGAK
jgi:hypothetical protein